MIQKTNAWTCTWLAFLVIIRDSSCSATPFELQGTHLTATEGSCIEIHCKFTGSQLDVNNDAQWFWIKDAKYIEATREFNGIIIYSTTSERPASQDLASRVKYTGSSSFKPYSQNRQCGILICNLKKTDSGNYSFRYDGKTAKTKWKTEPGVTLTVEENPCPIIFVGNVVNDTATLQCSTLPSCRSYPKITGFNQIETSQPKKENHNITVHFKTDWQDDGKVMSCQILNNMDTHLVQNVTLTVEYAPRNTLASVSPQDVREGNPVTLTCSTRGRPNSTFSWFKDEQQKVAGAEWKIGSIQASDSGEYYCEAQNKHGTNKSKKFTIDVKYAPSLATQMEPMSDVQEGGHVTLTCIVERSNPQPYHYTWYKDDKPIGDQVIYNISSIEPEHSGSYHCKATNSVGSDISTSRRIEVQYSPRNTGISRSGGETPVKVNDHVSLRCETDANPVPWSYTWYRHREHEQMNSPQWTVNTTSGNTLNFTRVERTDSGHYVCSATNGIQEGGNSSSLHLQVLYPPTKPELSLVPEAREGDIITIRCTVQSLPPSELTLRWTRPNSSTQLRLGPGYGSHPSNDRQESFNVTSTHAGLYTCSATNSEGSSSTHKELTVKYSPKNVTILDQPSIVEVDENTQLKLHCVAQSNPPVTSYTWTKTTPGGVEIVWQTDTFTVQSVAPSHRGQYTCEVRNDLGSGKSQQTTVEVKYAPKITTIISSQHDAKSPVMLSCISHGFPKVNVYKWFMEKDDICFSSEQNITVHPDKPGSYYCHASNDIDGKKSEPYKAFLDRGFMQFFPFILLCLVVVVALLTIFLVCRHKRNKSIQQGTSNSLPWWGRFGFLGRWNGTRENLVNEPGLAEPRRSRDDLTPGLPYRPNPQPCRPPPDSTCSSNINTVYCTVNLPMGTQEPIRNQAGHTEDDALNYVSLHIGNREKNRRGPKAEAGVDDVYAKVAKPRPPNKDEQGRLEDYENVNGACAPQCPMPVYSDTDTSEEDVEVNYTGVHFKAKPGHQAKHHRNRDYSDSDGAKTLYSRVNIA